MKSAEKMLSRAAYPEPDAAIGSDQADPAQTDM